MAYFNFNGIKIDGIACAVPSNLQFSDEYKPIFGEEEVEKFKEMTGVCASHRTTEHQTASDLGFAAAKRLLEKKGLKGEDIGCIIFASHSPDYRRPSTAFVLQKRLGVNREAVCYDISLGCSSLVVGLQAVSSTMLMSDDIKYGLLIVGDTAGKSICRTDRSSVMLFGEAGGAVLLKKDHDAAPIKELLRSDGSGYRYMIVPGGGYRNLHASEEEVMCEDGNKRSLMNSFIQGTSVFTFTIFDVPRIIKDFWNRTGTTVDDYDVYAFHQANLYILKQIAKKTKIPMEKLPITLDRYGNTSGASALMSLCDVYGNDNTANTIKVFACGFGIGLSWGCASFVLDCQDILPIIEDDTVFEEGIFTNPNQLYSKI